jgi:hypothetical protein
LLLKHKNKAREVSLYLLTTISWSGAELE